MTSLSHPPSTREAPPAGGYQLLYAGARVTVAPPSAVPFPVEAQVVEEDTHLLLSLEPVARVVDDSLDRLAREAAQFHPHPPGSVLARRDREPMRLLAVVHDVDRDPTWREEWIDAAHHQVWKTAASLGVGSIAMPLLGTCHGKLHPARALHLLVRAMAHREAAKPRTRVWIQTPAHACAETYAMLLARRLG